MSVPSRDDAAVRDEIGLDRNRCLA